MAVPIFLPSETFGLPDTVVTESPGACPQGKVALPGLTCIVAPCPTFCVTGETFIQGGGPPPEEPPAQAGLAPQTVGAGLAAVAIALFLWLNRNARRR